MDFELENPRPLPVWRLPTAWLGDSVNLREPPFSHLGDININNRVFTIFSYDMTCCKMEGIVITCINVFFDWTKFNIHNGQKNALASETVSPHVRKVRRAFSNIKLVACKESRIVPDEPQVGSCISTPCSGKVIVLQTHDYYSIQKYMGNIVQNAVMFMTILISIQDWNPCWFKLWHKVSVGVLWLGK